MVASAPQGNAFRFSTSSSNDARYGGVARWNGSAGTGRYAPYTKDYVALFYENLRRWQSETAFLSDPERIVQHECYKALVEIAPYILDEIVSELNKSSSHLVWVLEDAFGEQPYSDEDSGNMRAMILGWAEWANRRGQVG